MACQKGPEYSVELDGNSLKKMVATKEEFVGGMPADFKPMSMNCVSNYDYLVSNLALNAVISAAWLIG